MAGAITGCGAASSGGAARVPQGELEQYFVGTQTFVLPDGTEVQRNTLVAHRTLQPDAHAILEEVIERDADGAVETHAIRLDVDATDRHFVLSAPGGMMSGEGELTGDAWQWTAWHAETRLPDGMRVVTDDALTDTELRGESRVLGADGNTEVIIRHVLTRVARERWEQERAAMQEGARSGDDAAAASEPPQ